MLPFDEYHSYRSAGARPKRAKVFALFDFGVGSRRRLLHWEEIWCECSRMTQQELEAALLDVKSDVAALQFLIEMMLTREFASETEGLGKFDQIVLDIQQQILTLSVPGAPPQQAVRIRKRLSESLSEILRNIRYRLVDNEKGQKGH